MNITTTSKKNSAFPVTKYMPNYKKHVDKNIILLDDGRLMAVIAIKGSPYLLENPNELQSNFNSYKENLVTLGKLNAKNLEIKTTLVKREFKLQDKYKFKNKFAQQFADRYTKEFNNTSFYDVSYYLSFIISFEDLFDGIEDLNNIIKSALVAFNSYNAMALGLVKNGSKISCGIKQFLYYLFNHQLNHDLLGPSSTNIIDGITDSDLHFGYDICEIRNKNSLTNHYAVCNNLAEYPALTSAGMWDNVILSSPCEFILTQTFHYMTISKALKELTDKEKLLDANELLVDQSAELSIAKKTLVAGEIALGSYHASLIVFGKTPEDALDKNTALCTDLASANEHGIRFTKATFENFYSFFSMFPACKSKFLVLAEIKSTTNLACGFSLHNNPTGKQYGNPIGDGLALMPLKTNSKGLMFLNCHYSEPFINVTGEPYPGHSLFLGATGTGKTTLQSAITAFCDRFDPCMFGIDCNRSFELLFRALHGKYFVIREGIDIGLAPFQLEEQASPEYKSFLYKLVRSCALAGYEKQALTDEEDNNCRIAVDTVLELPIETRRFSLLLQSLVDGTSLKTRLARWCYSANGEFAWALDAPVNKFNPKELNKIAFDGTKILRKGCAVTEPILATLFYYKDIMRANRPLMLSIIEEFWLPCNFPLTQELIYEALKAGRIKGEFLFLVSQSPADAIKCEIFEAIVEQTITKILLPNPDAKYSDYKLIGLNEFEFKKLKELGKNSRKFLIKQSHESSICEMQLHGFDEFLPILSGKEKDIELVEKIMNELGTDDPDIWIPEFHLRKGNSISQGDNL